MRAVKLRLSHVADPDPSKIFPTSEFNSIDPVDYLVPLDEQHQLFLSPRIDEWNSPDPSMLPRNGGRDWSAALVVEAVAEWFVL